MIIKVCGITRRRDALDSVRYGANALGFNFYPPSPRYLEPERARALADELPPEVLPVAIAVSRPGEDSWMRLPFDVIQLHGIEDPSQVPSTDRRVWIATGPSGARRFPDHEVIIDTSWGTGTLADWNALESLNRPFLLSGGLTPENLGEALDRLDPPAARGKSPHGIRPSLHPGGLRCDSGTYSRYAPESRLVRRAQERSRCSRDFHHGLLGVDVCSGVESAPGIKDRGKLRAFLKVARQHAVQTGDQDK